MNLDLSEVLGFQLGAALSRLFARRAESTAPTVQGFIDAVAERVRQLDKWGHQSHPDVPWLREDSGEYLNAQGREHDSKHACEAAFKEGCGTWWHIANEELADAIRLHARSLTHQKPIELALDLSETAAIADWAAHDVYRVAQEAIANAVRHAAPTRIVVRLVELPGSIILEVRDDGRGFDPDAVYPGKGLIGMRERAAALGAHLQIESGPGRGTVVRLQLQQSRGDGLA